MTRASTKRAKQMAAQKTKQMATTALSTTIAYEEITPERFALLVINTVRKCGGLAITDAITKTSKDHNLTYHLGYYEFGQAKAEVIRLIRHAKAPTVFDANGEGINGIEQGKFHNLLGTKIFPDQDRGRVPSWAGNTLPRALVYGSAPTGRDLPIVQDFLNYQIAMLHLGEDDFSEEWVGRKVRAAPVVRDQDLGLAIKAMKHRIKLIKEAGDLNQKIRVLSDDVARLSRMAFAQSEMQPA